MNRFLASFLLAATALAAEPVFDPGGMTVLKLLPEATRAAKPADVDIEVWPTGLIDAERVHYLTRGTVTILILAPANPLSRPLEKAWLIAELPPGVELKSTNAYLPWHLLERTAVERDGQAYVHIEVPLSTHVTTFPRGRGKGAWHSRSRPPALWLTTELPAGSRPGKLYYRLRYKESGSGLSLEVPAGPGAKAPDAVPGPTLDEPEAPPGMRLSAEHAVELAVLPETVADQPRLASSGCMGRFILNGTNPAFEQGAMVAGYAKQLGYTYLITHLKTPAMEGIAIWHESPLNNGFSMSTPEEVPERWRYQAAGQPAGKNLSPAALLGDDPWIRQQVWGTIRERHADGGAWANWEPYGFMDHPDTGEATMKAFAAWAKLPEAEVKAAWPDRIRETHGAEFKRFYNAQLGAIAKRFAAEIAPAPLAIAMSNDALWATTREHGCSALEWGDFAVVLQTWSYYFVPNAEGPWPIGDRLGAAQVVRSGALTDWIDRHFGEDRQLRLGCLYGWDQTGGGGYFLPEQLGFLHLSTILAGMDNVQNYAEFPIWDGRYAAEMARANSRIARWERFVLQGKRERTHRLTPLTPYPPHPAEQPTGGWAQPGYLWSYEYALEGQRLIAVANTWNDAEVFCRLEIRGLDAGRRYRLREPEAGRCFANQAGETELTAAELEAGLTVQVGAMRWGCFLIEPAGGAPAAGEIVHPEAVRRLILTRTFPQPPQPENHP